MLKVSQLTFAYLDKPVLRDIDFMVREGEHLSVIGESGSGKSTLLKLLYGEYDLDVGHVYWKDTEVLGPKFNLVVGYDFMKQVTQEFDLEPNTSVAQNVGQFLSNFYPEEKKTRTAELLEVVQLTDFAKTKVKLLSGGQKQRVALARAIAKQPEIILLDEPFSHIDNFKKQGLRRNLFRYLKKNNITCIVATHDKDDVLGYADTMIVLNGERIVAKDSPERLYRNPGSPLVASFFGEFNVLNDKIVYAHQLRVVPKSGLEAVVRKSYFKGTHFLVEAVFQDSPIFLEHEVELPEGKTIHVAAK